jgi:glycosyltransferase involved in cell wall biosynthesis
MKAFAELGHETFAVCTAGAAEGFELPVICVQDSSCFAKAEFWKSIKADLVLFMNWLVMANIMRALKEAGITVVSLADSDGLIGCRVHPGSTLIRIVSQHKSLSLKLRAVKYWLQKYLYLDKSEQAEYLESARCADRIVVGAEGVVVELSKFMAYAHASQLMNKVVCIPYPVDPCFLSIPVNIRRSRQIVSIGRWDDPQKNASLLRRVIEMANAHGTDFKFIIIGRGGENIFKTLQSQISNVECRGFQSLRQIRQILSESEVLLITSRWEGTPLIANEALVSGCTIVGTPLPSLKSYCAERAFGNLSENHCAASLVRALETELAAWQSGRRDPVKIASRWRPVFDPVSVCKQLLEGLDDEPENSTGVAEWRS